MILTSKNVRDAASAAAIVNRPKLVLVPVKPTTFPALLVRKRYIDHDDATEKKNPQKKLRANGFGLA